MNNYQERKVREILKIYVSERETVGEKVREWKSLKDIMGACVRESDRESE